MDFLGSLQNHTVFGRLMRKESLTGAQSMSFLVRICSMIVINSDEESNEVELSTSEDWDVKTITSALKLYLR